MSAYLALQLDHYRAPHLDIKKRSVTVYSLHYRKTQPFNLMPTFHDQMVRTVEDTEMLYS